jgi:hypothetical protein
VNDSYSIASVSLKRETLHAPILLDLNFNDAKFLLEL